MRTREDFRTAAAITAVGCGLGFASGRTQAVFCGQTLRTSWLGAVFSALMFALLVFMLCHLKRRTGAQRFPGVYRRLLGCHAGRCIGVLYALALVVSASLLLNAAAKVGMLVLPVQNAARIAALAALLLAGMLAAVGECTLPVAGGAYLALLLALELALWRFGGSPRPAQLQFVVELYLRDSLSAALVLGALCACMSAALAAGVAVRMTGGRNSPGGVGILCGLMYLLVQLAGNAVLQRQSVEVLCLRTPFVALTALWGTAGFYLSAGLIYLASVTALAGVLYALLPLRPAPRSQMGAHPGVALRSEGVDRNTGC